ncbi:MAG: cell division protein ZapA [Rickettsiales bacterium]
MAVVDVKINGKSYQLACDDGQEEHLRTLGDDVDDLIRELAGRVGGGLSEVMGLLMASVTMADELIENKKEINKILEENKKYRAIIEQGGGQVIDEGERIDDAIATTIEEIAQRIEKIADSLQIS